MSCAFYISCNVHGVAQLRTMIYDQNSCWWSTWVFFSLSVRNNERLILTSVKGSRWTPDRAPSQDCLKSHFEHLDPNKCLVFYDPESSSSWSLTANYYMGFCSSTIKGEWIVFIILPLRYVSVDEYLYQPWSGTAFSACPWHGRPATSFKPTTTIAKNKSSQYYKQPLKVSDNQQQTVAKELSFLSPYWYPMVEYQLMISL